MIDKNDYIKWLDSGIQQQESYHNHKETMAWVITALYVPGIIYFGYAIHKTSISVWVAIGFMAVLGYLVFLFANMQFRMRWEAADVVHILMRRMANLHHGDELPRPDEWLIDKPDKQVWPHFVQCEICRLRERRKCWKLLIASLLFCRKYDDYDRWKTEIPSYLVIIVATGFAIYLAICN